MCGIADGQGCDHIVNQGTAPPHALTAIGGPTDACFSGWCLSSSYSAGQPVCGKVSAGDDCTAVSSGATAACATGWCLSTGTCGAQPASSTGDPHLVLYGGGKADFRGINNTIFAFLAAPNFQLNILTSDVSFERWNRQIVHGSYLTQLFFKARSAVTGRVLRIGIIAAQWGSFRVYAADDMVSHRNVTRIDLPTWSDFPDIEVLQMRMGRTVIHGAGWKLIVKRNRVRLPLIAGCKWSESAHNISACYAPKDHPSRYFLDFTLKTLDDESELVKKFGKSTVGRIAPHGLVGQSFDGNKVAVSGRLDTYPVQEKEVTTKAQAEGAVEGTYLDYIVAAPFSTVFKYARFNVTHPVLPRDVTKLTGVKTSFPEGTPNSAGASQLHGVEVERAAV